MANYKKRRAHIFDQMAENSIAMLVSAPIQYRNQDAERLYRQDSYFYYMTGFEEPDSVAVFIKQKQEMQFLLFCQDKSPEEARWTGPSLGSQAASQKLQADKAYPIETFDERMMDCLLNKQEIYYLVGHDPVFEQKLLGWLNLLRKKQRKGVSIPHQLTDFCVLLDEARLFKSPEEITCLKKACQATVAGHQRAMQKASPDLYEYHLEAELLYSFYQNDCRHMAYNAIVAGGNNACILHYVDNNQKIYHM